MEVEAADVRIRDLVEHPHRIRHRHIVRLALQDHGGILDLHDVIMTMADTLNDPRCLHVHERGVIIGALGFSENANHSHFQRIHTRYVEDLLGR